uniref:MYND-type domain-containing protein n=1 Tax=Triticum urartu TaxID=4572 RepID=A0A8R7R9R3_TRIUA
MCGLCKRMKYCSRECQLKHWHSDHKFKCKQMRLLDPVENLPCGVEVSGKNNEKRKQRSNDCYPPNK